MAAVMTAGDCSASFAELQLNEVVMAMNWYS